MAGDQEGQQQVGGGGGGSGGGGGRVGDVDERVAKAEHLQAKGDVMETAIGVDGSRKTVPATVAQGLPSNPTIGQQQQQQQQQQRQVVWMMSDTIV